MNGAVPPVRLVSEQQLSDLLHSLTAGRAYRVHSTDVWLVARADLAAEHGWKLHVSARAADLAELAELVLPVLIAEGCSFKLAKSASALTRLNDGMSAPAAVGKAITVYPALDRVRPLGLRLADLLDGRVGPRIRSDRRVTDTAPVYYRYGPFVSKWRADSAGRLLSTLTGPDGQRFDAAATLAYRRPDWTTDPFTGQVERLPTGRLIGGRYEIVSGVLQAARGDIYRARPIGRDDRLIIKQARAFVAEDGDGMDTRSRLRHERRVLAALEGVVGVPAFLDHFRHGEDEYLVISDQGQLTLAEDVARFGRYSGTEARSLPSLARQLAGILVAVHQRGVISRDVAPKNVIVDTDQVSLVDFGIAAYNGQQLGGSTAGYASPAQLRGEPGDPADDAHALGMTLLFAATGSHPVVSEDGEVTRIRALQALTIDDGRFASLAGAIAGPDRPGPDTIPARAGRSGRQQANTQPGRASTTSTYAHRGIAGPDHRRVA